MGKRVCCLYRVSTLKQVEKDDIPMQKQRCHEFAAQMGWDIVREFSEKGVSGFKVSAKQRDAIQEIQREAALNTFDILLVFMFDRLGRRDDETPFIVEWFVNNGIEVWSAEEGQQRFDNHVDKLLNYIRYWQASGESIKTSTMPQSINKYGTYTVRAKDDAEADKLIRDAHLLEEAGCFAIVLEKIPATLAERVAAELTIPIIGIGAGGHVDGQVLVIQDMLGMNNGFRPRFLRRYADLYTVMTDAISRYVSDVKNCYFPNEKEQY